LIHELKKESTHKLLKSPHTTWQADKQAVLSGDGLKDLPGPWKLMLLGDGSPTRHLRLITGFDVEVKVIAMNNEPLIAKGVPEEVQELKSPLIRRQVWLTCNDQILAWAESWWNQKEAQHHLKEKDQPIWKSLTEGRSEIFREVDGLALVNSNWLEDSFRKKGPFWSRHYRFFRQEKELTVIREVFNPALEKWLGPAKRQKPNAI
tara:strand:+ start:457 stop:1071 length:615 start_codon:yes stop_codon:yes gene_type:complete